MCVLQHTADSSKVLPVLYRQVADIYIITPHSSPHSPCAWFVYPVVNHAPCVLLGNLYHTVLSKVVRAARSTQRPEWPAIILMLIDMCYVMCRTYATILYIYLFIVMCVPSPTHPPPASCIHTCMHRCACASARASHVCISPRVSSSTTGRSRIWEGELR